MRKLSDVQAWLTDHGARLDAITERLLDQETRIITLEETVAGLIIPRVLPFRSSSHSSPHEYKVYVEPVVGTPLTVQVEAETDREAIEKAERMFNTPLVKTEILSKVLTAREKAVEELRLVAKVKPRKIEGTSNPVKVELTLLTCPFCRRSAIYPVYYWNKRRLTEAVKCYACNEIFSLKKESVSNPIKLKCKLCGKVLPTRSVEEYMKHLELEHALFFPELVERYFYEFIENPQVRRLGVPRTDVERVMVHYGVSRETAENMIREVGVKALLPPRGARLEGGEIANPSRWVLEMYPLDVLAWRRSLIELAGKPLTASEHRLVSNYDDYLRRRGYLTSRQIEVLSEIARRHYVELPAIPTRVT